MSNCEKCGNNIMPQFPTCNSGISQVDTDQGIRSKILACPEFTASTVLDFSPRDQIGGVI